MAFNVMAVSISVSPLRIEDDDTPASLISRYGRTNLEEVFFDIARGEGEAREAAS